MMRILRGLKPLIVAKIRTHVLFGKSPAFKRAYWMIACLWVAVVVVLLTAKMAHLPSLTVISLSLILVAFVCAFSWYFPNWYYAFLSNKFYRIKENPMMNSYLQGNYAPIQKEIIEHDLKIHGDLPKELCGTYMRNGPNPAFVPISYTYPIDGDGMLHAIEVCEGKASYRNRYVETEAYLAEREAGEALYSGISRPLWTTPSFIEKYGEHAFVKNGAAIHIIQHANQYLALSEAAVAYEVSERLKTLGTWCPPGGRRPFYINAHTRLDRATGDLYGFTYDIIPPRLTYYVLDKTGALKEEGHINKSYASLIHDFVLTEHYLIFFDCPAIFDFSKLWTEGQLLNWQPEHNTTVILVHRQTKAVSKIEMDPFFAYHLANGYEVGEHLIIDYVRHEILTLGEALHSNFTLLYRLTIDLKTQVFSHHELYDRPVEFPRINEAFISRPYRYVYAPVKTLGHVNAFHGLLKYDLESKKALVHDFGDTQEIGEAVFIPKPNETTEEKGWLGLLLYDSKKESSEFILLDAENFLAAPVARIELPQRVPHGLHGSWFSSVQGGS